RRRAPAACRRSPRDVARGWHGCTSVEALPLSPICPDTRARWKSRWGYQARRGRPRSRAPDGTDSALQEHLLRSSSNTLGGGTRGGARSKRSSPFDGPPATGGPRLRDCSFAREAHGCLTADLLGLFLTRFLCIEAFFQATLRRDSRDSSGRSVRGA